MRGFAVSTGSACFSRSLEASHVILGIGGDHERAHGSVRFTFGRYNQDEDVDARGRRDGRSHCRACGPSARWERSRADVMPFPIVKSSWSIFRIRTTWGASRTPDAKSIEGSPACGDMVAVYLKVDEEPQRITDIKFESYGCASNIATGSIITELAKGKTLEEAKRHHLAAGLRRAGRAAGRSRCTARCWPSTACAPPSRTMRSATA